MKVAVISDTHLLDTFIEEKYQYLENVIKSHDKIIINGDLWEGQIISFDDFIESEWSKLFPLLKERGSIYLYGNHDKENMMDDRWKLFADEIHYSYDLPLENCEDVLHITHGDQYVNFPFTSLRTHPIFLKSVAYPNRLRIQFEEWLGGEIGWKKGELLKMQRSPDKMINEASEEKYEGKILVVSHFHFPIFLPEQKYINTGMILNHMASYLSIVDGKLKLIKESY